MLLDSLNQYQSLEAVTADSPQDLVTVLKSINAQFRIISIVQVGNRSVAYICSDLNKEKSQLKKVK